MTWRLKLANEMNISWPLPEGTTDADLEKQFKSPASTTTAKRMPDYDYICKELLKNGVTKKLLWTEYMDEFNRRPFQKKEGSRYELFHAEELPLLTPLPATRYELAEWKQATVQYNYQYIC